tara:strand:- start:192 stop:683 length:492 start_codon:yes stop_codon:yes gene_type:complete
MYKIKLLILLLTSVLIFSCAKENEKLPNNKYSLAYIGGEYDGLLLKNLLSAHLKNFDLYSNQSRYEIRSNISHSNNIFITNIDNTSDRERVTSNIVIEIFDKEEGCLTDNFEKEIEQFFVYASSDKFMSNQKALEKIKFDNTETLIKKFINYINNINHRCHAE